MPFAAIAPFLPAIIGAGASIAGSALSGSHSSATPTLSPEMQALQNRLSSYSTGLMDNPTQGLAPMKLAATDQINRNYAQMPRTVTSELSARGFGKSGKLGTAMYNIGSARAGDLTNMEGQFAQMATTRQQQGAGLAEQLLSGGRGMSYTGGGNPLGNGLMSGGNALGNLAQLLMLSKTFKETSGGGGYGGDYSSTGTFDTGAASGDSGYGGGIPITGQF